MGNYGWFLAVGSVLAVLLLAAFTKFGRTMTKRVLKRMFGRSYREVVLEAALSRSATTFGERLAATQNPERADVRALNRQLDAFVAAVTPLFDLSEAQCAKVRDVAWKCAMQRLDAADVGEQLQQQRQPVRHIRR